MHNPVPNPLLLPTASELLFARSFALRGGAAGLDAAGDTVQRQAFGPRSSYNQLPLQAAIDDSRNVIALASLMRHQPAPQIVFPGGTTLFLRADGSFTAPTASVADPNSQSYTPGGFTVATGKYIITAKRIQLTGSQRATLQGTARWRHT